MQRLRLEEGSLGEQPAKYINAPWQFYNDNVSMLHCNSVVAMLLEQKNLAGARRRRLRSTICEISKNKKHLLPLVGNFVQSALLYCCKYVQFWKSKLSTACFKHTNFSIIMGHIGLLWLLINGNGQFSADMNLKLNMFTRLGLFMTHPPPEGFGSTCRSATA